MTKKNLKVEIAVRVFGKELTREEADELYSQLGRALGKSLFPNYVYPYQPYRPHWSGGYTTTNNAGSSMTQMESGNFYGKSLVAQAFSGSPMVEIVNSDG